MYVHHKTILYIPFLLLLSLAPSHSFQTILIKLKKKIYLDILLYFVLLLICISLGFFFIFSSVFVAYQRTHLNQGTFVYIFTCTRRNVFITIKWQLDLIWCVESTNGENDLIYRLDFGTVSLTFFFSWKNGERQWAAKWERMRERSFKHFKICLVIVCLFAQLVRHKTNIRVIAILYHVFISKIGFKQIPLPNLAFVLSTHKTSNDTHERQSTICSLFHWTKLDIHVI